MTTSGEILSYYESKTTDFFVCVSCHKVKMNSNVILLKCLHIFHIDCMMMKYIVNPIFIKMPQCIKCGEHIEVSTFDYIKTVFYEIMDVRINECETFVENISIKINALRAERKRTLDMQQKCLNDKRIIQNFK